MTRRRRHELILTRLAQQGEVSAEALAGEFGVNVITIRRDLASLAEQGLVRRTHGGALAEPRSRIEFTFQRRQQANLAEKAAIAEAAVRFIQPGMAVSLDTGTTTLEVARRLCGLAPLKVLTSSLVIAAELCRSDGIELVLLGGTVRKDSPDMFGLLTEENLRRFRVNLAIVGADAASPDGLFTTDSNIARVSAAMLAGGEQAMLVTDHTKFAATAFVRFAGWADIDRVVTDDCLPADARAWLERAAAVTYALSPAAAPHPLPEGKR